MSSKLSQLDYRRHVIRYAQIVLGCLITALGFNLFLLPAHLLTGGLSGVAIIIYYLTGLPSSTTSRFSTSRTASSGGTTRSIRLSVRRFSRSSSTRRAS